MQTPRPSTSTLPPRAPVPSSACLSSASGHWPYANSLLAFSGSVSPYHRASPRHTCAEHTPQLAHRRTVRRHIHGARPPRSIRRLRPSPTPSYPAYPTCPNVPCPRNQPNFRHPQTVRRTHVRHPRPRCSCCRPHVAPGRLSPAHVGCCITAAPARATLSSFESRGTVGPRVHPPRAHNLPCSPTKHGLASSCAILSVNRHARARRLSPASEQP